MMLSGYSVTVGLEEALVEPADHFVAHQAVAVADRDQDAPYCLRAPLGPGERTLPHTAYSGYGKTPAEALQVALEACRRDWPGIEIIHEATVDRIRRVYPG